MREECMKKVADEWPGMSKGENNIIQNRYSFSLLYFFSVVFSKRLRRYNLKHRLLLFVMISSPIFFSTTALRRHSNPHVLAHTFWSCAPRVLS